MTDILFEDGLTPCGLAGFNTHTHVFSSDTSVNSGWVKKKPDLVSETEIKCSYFAYRTGEGRSDPKWSQETHPGRVLMPGVN